MTSNIKQALTRVHTPSMLLSMTVGVELLIMMSNYNTTFFLLPLLPFVFAAEYDVDDGFCYCYFVLLLLLYVSYAFFLI